MIAVQAATPQDVPAIADLLEELDRYYGDDPAGTRDQRVAQIHQALFSPTPDARALLAWDDSTLAGLAIYTYLWPAAGVSRSLYLKELFVSEQHRAKGIGKLLMQHLARIAVEQQCSRIEWTAEEDNPTALQFYKSLDIPRHNSKIFYRINERDIQEMANPA